MQGWLLAVIIAAGPFVGVCTRQVVSTPQGPAHMCEGVSARRTAAGTRESPQLHPTNVSHPPKAHFSAGHPGYPCKPPRSF